MPMKKENKDKILSQNELLEREEPILDNMYVYNMALGKRKHKVCSMCLSNNKLGSTHCWACGADERQIKNLWVYLSEEDKKKEKEKYEFLTDFNDDIL